MLWLSCCCRIGSLHVNGVPGKPMPLNLPVQSALWWFVLLIQRKREA
jgi:hypothetical protein